MRLTFWKFSFKILRARIYTVRDGIWQKMWGTIINTNLVFHYTLFKTENIFVFIPLQFSLLRVLSTKYATVENNDLPTTIRHYAISWEEKTVLFFLRNSSVSIRFFRATVMSLLGLSVKSNIPYYPIFLLKHFY